MPLVPDGRTVLTEPEALNSCNGPVGGHGGIYRPFIPDTNSIEALHRQVRKIIQDSRALPGRGRRKLIYLAITPVGRKWRRVFHWLTALAACKIQFPDRIPNSDLPLS
jgi:hypothetical protein